MNRINSNNYFRFSETDRIVEAAQYLADWALGDIEEIVHTKEHNYDFRRDYRAFSGPEADEWKSMAEEEWEAISPKQIQDAAYLDRPITVKELELAYAEFIMYYAEEGSSRVDSHVSFYNGEREYD